MVSPYLLGAVKGLEQAFAQRELKRKSDLKEQRDKEIFDMKKREFDLKEKKLVDERNRMIEYNKYMTNLPRLKSEVTGIQKEIDVTDLEQKKLDFIGLRELQRKLDAEGRRRKTPLEQPTSIEQRPLDAPYDPVKDPKTQFKETQALEKAEYKKAFPGIQKKVLEEGQRLGLEREEKLSPLRQKKAEAIEKIKEGMYKFADPKKSQELLAKKLFAEKTKAKLGTYGKRLEYYKKVFPERFGKDPDFFAKLAAGIIKVEPNTGGNPNFARVTDQLKGTVYYRPLNSAFGKKHYGAPLDRDKKDDPRLFAESPMNKLKYFNIFTNSPYYKEAKEYKRKTNPGYETTTEMLLANISSRWYQSYGLLGNVGQAISNVGSQLAPTYFADDELKERKQRMRATTQQLIVKLKSSGRALAQEQDRIAKLVGNTSSIIQSDRNILAGLAEIQDLLETSYARNMSMLRTPGITRAEYNKALKGAKDEAAMLAQMGDVKEGLAQLARVKRDTQDMKDRLSSKGYGKDAAVMCGIHSIGPYAGQPVGRNEKNEVVFDEKTGTALVCGSPSQGIDLRATNLLKGMNKDEYLKAEKDAQIKIKKREKEAERKRPSIKKGEKTLSGSISKFKKMQKKYRKTPRKTPRKNEFGSIE